MISTETKIITPKIAGEMLEKNTSNYRQIQNSKVNTYASEMQAGLWQENGEPIVFDEDGVLKNGQHRLTAIIRANVSIKMLVVYGVSRDVTAFDLGKIRSISEIARAEGVLCDNTTSGAAGIIFKGFENASHYGKMELLAYVNNHANNFTKARLISCRGKTSPIMKKAGCVAAIYAALVIGLMSEKDLESFCEIVNSGMPKEGCISDSPLALRNTINEGFRNENGALILSGSSLRRPLFETTWQALNAYKEGRKPKRKFRPDGKGDAVLEKVRAFDVLVSESA